MMEQLIGQSLDDYNQLRDRAQLIAKESKFAIVKGNSSARDIKLICVHGGEPKNSRKLTAETRKRQRSSFKTNCQWALFASKNKDTNGKFKVTKIIPGHNHPMAIDPMIYHQHRQLLEEASSVAQAMLLAGLSVSSVAETMTVYCGGRVVTKQDIQNLRNLICPEQLTKTVLELISFFQERSYTVLYSYDEQTKVLKSLFFCHEHSIAKARRFSEVMTIDATYKTNILSMPLIKVVGIGNTVDKALSSFLIACAYVLDEKASTYQTFAQQLKEAIYSDINPGLIITD